MFLVNSTLISSRGKELPLLGLVFKRFQRAQIIELCHAASVATPSLEESVQRNLPCLPVQPLEQMLEKYIKSVRPFVNTLELEKTKQLIKNFSGDENSGKKLQRLLEDRVKSVDNWLAEWWLQTAYLEFRDPVIIYSSPALVWPKRNFKSQQEQLVFAAYVIEAALIFSRKIVKKEIPKDKIGNNFLCMNQYEKLFGTCRIPKIPRDELLLQDQQNLSTHFIVFYNNHLFSLPAFQNSEREIFSASHFYSMLLDVVAEGDRPGVPVGILTTEHRDNWARSYEELKKNVRNKHILEEYVEKALFVVCIDKPIGLSCDLLSYETKCSKLLLHGFGFSGNAGNRWYDKTIQFVIGAGSDGVGIVYEHSPAEGGPVAVLTDFINSNITDVPKELIAAPNYPKPEKLEFALSDLIKDNINRAGAAVNRLSDDLEVYGWSFTDFGKNEIKSLKVSPDSFIQVAIQYAFYKVHSRPAAQYESGSLRKFIHGRTDTIRSCTEEVVNFCETISKPSATSVEMSRALCRAIDSHKNYALEVLEGRGIDRHLLGLKLLAKLNNMEVPKIFEDSAYERSTYFQLSTSNVPTKCNAFMIYGPLVYDGYACCYNPREKNINFGMSAWSSCKTTFLDEFQISLKEALNSMRSLLLDSFKTSKL